jgi:hypothetical protein
VRLVARFLKDLLVRQPDASIRVVITGLNAAVPLQASMTFEACEVIVGWLLERYSDASAADPSMPWTANVAGPGQFLVEIDGPPSMSASAAPSVPITVYLADENIHEQVESAIDDLLANVGMEVTARVDPVRGSWFRRMQAGARKIADSPSGRDAVLTAVHAVDSHVVLWQDAQTTALLLQNLGPVLTSLQPTRDAVLRIGALLVVKVDWSVQIFQLTAAQQAILDHQSQLAMRPQEILQVLQLPGSASEVSESEIGPKGDAAEA